MSSGFSGGYPDFFSAKGGGVNNVSGRSISLMNANNVIRGSYSYRSDLIGKRSLLEFQQQHQFGQSPPVHLRNVKPRAYNQHTDLLISPELSSVSNLSSSSQQIRPMSNHQINNLYGRKQSSVNQELERKMLRELEKELLLDDEEEGENDDVSVVTDTEWSETIRKLLSPVQAKQPGNMVSPSPTTSSSSSSCASSSATISPKQLISDAAEAISDGKSEIAMELVTRLDQYSNARGTPEQRLGLYMASALRSRLRVKSTVEDKSCSAFTELCKKEHILSTQLLYDKSPCFKLAFMAANNVIMQTLSGWSSGRPESNINIHVVDFDIGQGLQYVYLIHAIAAARKVETGISISLKLTTFKDFGNGGFERLKLVGDGLKLLSNKLGVFFHYNVLEFKLSEICKPGLAVEKGDVLVVNFAFKLNKFPDESVSTENLRDEILRRVKGMSPAVVTVAEQELNTNTASFTTRVNDVFSYYTTLDATIPGEKWERVKIEEGLGRRIVNSVACEGRERVERCEVFGKWRARLRMAGFDQKPVSQTTVESLMLMVNSGIRGNPSFSVKEDSGGVSFGWLGRTLTVVSAWR